MSRHVPLGYIDAIQNGYIVGWATSHTNNGSPANLFLFIDDELADNFSCDIDRPDIEPLGLSGKRAGFKTPVPERFMDGAAHTICIRSNGGEYLLVPDPNGGFAQSAIVSLKPAKILTSYIDGLTNGALRGWAVLQDGAGLKSGGLDIIAHCAGVEIGLVKADKHRPDVARAVDCDPCCGFMLVPPIRYRDGRSYSFDLSLASTGEPLANSPILVAYPPHQSETKLAQLYDAVETMSTQLFQIKRELRGMLTRNVITLDDYDGWARQYQAALRHRRRQLQWPADRPRPLVSILCPVYRPRPTDLKAAIDSVLDQTYRDLELILVNDNSAQPELTAILEAYAKRDKRVRVIAQPKNTGISGATNTAIAAAHGEYIAFFDHDDLLMDVAVEIMVEAALLSGAQLLYSDEDKLDDFGRFSDPNLKSAWNYRLLLAQNYVCHFLVVKAETLAKTGPLRKKYDGAQDHDLILRLSEQVPPERIVHVPEIIYHWRKTKNSTASATAAKPYAIRAGALAIQDHLTRRGLTAKATTIRNATTYDLAWSFKTEPTVTIIIPYREQIELTRRCLNAILTQTNYGAYQICLIDNWSVTDASQAFAAEANTKGVTVVRVEEPFNYSRLNNLACLQTNSEFVLFMNNDVLVQQPDWLRRLVDEALADPLVAAVGAKLLFPDQTIQHGGVILGVGGIGDHAYRGRAATDPQFGSRGICAQELSAVTAALMLCRTEAFHAVGGFDEQDLAIAYNDVDLCLKLRRLGRKVVFCPSVLAEHHESVSRGDDLSAERLGRFVFEESVMQARWHPEISADPFYNPNFSKEGGIFEQLSMDPLERAETPPRIRQSAAQPI